MRDQLVVRSTAADEKVVTMSLQTLLEDKRKELEDAHRTIEHTRTISEERLGELAQLRQQIQNLTVAHLDAEKKMKADHEAESQAAANSIQQLKGEIYSIAHKLKKVQAGRDSTEGEMRVMSAECSLLRSQCASLQGEKGRLGEIVSTLEKENSALGQHVEALQGTVDRITAHDIDMNRRLEAQAEALRELDKQNITNSSAYNSKLRELRLQLVSSEKNIREMHEKSAVQDEIIQKLRYCVEVLCCVIRSNMNYFYFY